MIEKIKKEINKIKKCNFPANWIEDCEYFENKITLINIKEVYNILDKYKGIDKYKRAWEKLKNSKDITIRRIVRNKNTGQLEIKNIIQELEQKYGIGEE